MPDGLRRAVPWSFEPRIAGLAFPFGQLLFGFILGNAVAFLDFAGEMLAAPGDDIEVVVQTHATFSSSTTAGGSGAITYTLRDDGHGLKVSSAVFVLTSANGG